MVSSIPTMMVITAFIGQRGPMYRKDDTPHIMHTFRCRREYVNVVQYNVDGDIYDRGGLDRISLFIGQLSFLMVVVTNNYYYQTAP